MVAVVSAAVVTVVVSMGVQVVEDGKERLLDSLKET